MTEVKEIEIEYGRIVIGRPQAPCHPRDEPFYIDTECPDCGTELVLNDKHRPTGDGSGARVAPEVWDERETVWYDEWVCPKCENGIHMDHPQ